MKSTLKWGLIGGLGAAILGLITFILNIKYDSWVSYLSYAILIAVILAGSYDFRDRINGGYAKFGEIFKYAILVSLIFATISTIWSVLFITVIHPEFTSELIEQSRIQFEEVGLDEATIEMSLSWTRTMMKPHFFALMSMFSLMFVGTLISLLISLVLRKEKHPDELIIDELEEEK